MSDISKVAGGASLGSMRRLSRALTLYNKTTFSKIKIKKGSREKCDEKSPAWDGK
jgi:hypothetical protein